MATNSLCGMGGSVTGATGATEVYFWEITQTVDAIEATSFDSDGWKERIPCLIGATGTFKSQGSSSTVGAHAGCTFNDAAAGYTNTGNIVISNIAVSTPEIV